MFYSGYSVSLCCSVYCLRVIVFCTTDTGCQLRCSLKKYIISYVNNTQQYKAMFINIFIISVEFQNILCRK